MELHTFVSETLSQIITGIKTAQDIASKNNAEVSPTTSWIGDKSHTYPISDTSRNPVSFIKFDIALSVHEDSKSGVKAGIFVSIAGIGTNMDEAKGTSSHSRVQFEIPVVWPIIKKDN